jgi:hypothetical protein
MTSPAMAKAKGQTLRLSGQIVDMVEPGRLPQPKLPTPITTDHGRAASRWGMNSFIQLRDIDFLLNKKLPTPTTRDYKDGQAEHKRDGIVQTDTVARAVFNGDWGQYAPSIKRWEEIIGRKAPAPTKPSKNKEVQQLSSLFTEWMMGLPEGWVTGCGLSRNEELKACGNGVVPQQAVLALKMLLDNVPLERQRERTVMLPTPTVSDTFTDNLRSSQQKPGSMHSVTLPQAVRMVSES